jgi:hypothetical protein
VIEQIKQKVLNQEYLEELVKMANEELDSTPGLLEDKLDANDAELILIERICPYFYPENNLHNLT